MPTPSRPPSSPWASTSPQRSWEHSPRSVLGGANGTISVQVRETGTQVAAGTFSVKLFTAADGVTAASPFASIPERLKLKSGQAMTLHLKFAFPSSLSDGSYNVVATVDTGAVRDLNTVNNTAVSATVVDIAAPFIDLTGSGLVAPVFNGTKPASIAFTLTNNGNIAMGAKASTLQFLAATSGTLTGAVVIATQPLRPNLKASSSHAVRAKLVLPSTVPAGTYFLLALLDPSNVFDDTNTSNNLVVSGNTFVVG